MCWGGRWHWLSYGKLSGTRLKSLSRRFTTCINIPSSLHTWGKAWTPTRLLQCKKKKEPSSTSWVSVPRHKGDVQHNWHCDQVLKVNAESVRAWTEPLKQAIIFLRVGAVRTQDPQLGQLMVDLLKQLRFPHPVLIQSCLGLDHVFTQSWSCVPPPPSWSWLQHCPLHSTVNTLRPDIVLVFVSLGNSPSARGGLVGWGRGGEDSLHHRWD